MVVKLELKPEVQARLLTEAQAQGLSLGAYLEQVIQGHAIDAPALAGEAWEKEFDAWVNSFPDAPLSDEAISRDSLYPDR